MARPGHGSSANLWVITTYFNPLGWSSRLANYRQFRQRIGAPLLTVEWSPSGSFQLGREDADILVSVAGGDLLWQKERLLNVALAHLPAACTAVAWIDGDVLFQDPGWPEAACACLEDHDVIQLFSQVVHRRPETGGGGQPPEVAGPPHAPASSFLASYLGLEEPRQWLRRHLRKRLEMFRAGIDPEAPVVPNRVPGFAWAARRDWLQAGGGFLDTGILGGADRLQLYTWLNADPDQLAQLHEASVLCEGTSRRARQWAASMRRYPPRPGCLGGTIEHLHHGDLRHRRYLDRHQHLAATGFDADRDLELAEGGAWRFTPQAPPGLRELMDRYFAERREDGAAPGPRPPARFETMGPPLLPSP